MRTRVDRLSGVCTKPHKDEIVLNFHCLVTGGRLRPTDEADGARHFPLDDLAATLLPLQCERILAAAAPSRWPIVRKQGVDLLP